MSVTRRCTPPDMGTYSIEVTIVVLHDEEDEKVTPLMNATPVTGTIKAESDVEALRLVRANVEHALNRPDPTDPHRKILVDGKWVEAGPNVQGGSTRRPQCDVWTIRDLDFNNAIETIRNKVGEAERTAAQLKVTTPAS